mmetsp:Transcript_25191/g.37554  ORF Transcript_25191/g.37554 Transcript_25191/m.37554 type:complete len:1222 (-) Transcript_25191:33-3698(-)
MTTPPPPPPASRNKSHDSFEEYNNAGDMDEKNAKTTSLTHHDRVDPSHPISSLPFITPASNPSTPTASNIMIAGGGIGGGGGGTSSASFASSHKTLSSASTKHISHVPSESPKPKFFSLGHGKTRERRVAILFTCFLLFIIVILGPNGLLERSSPTDTAHATTSTGYHLAAHNGHSNVNVATSSTKPKKQNTEDESSFLRLDFAENGKFKPSKNAGNDFESWEDAALDVVDVDYAPVSTASFSSVATDGAASTNQFQVIKEVDDEVPLDTASSSVINAHASDELECRDSVIAFVINATDAKDECEGLRKAFDTTCSATTSSSGGGAAAARRRRLTEKKEYQYVESILFHLHGMFDRISNLNMDAFSWILGGVNKMDQNLEFYPENEITKIWGDVREKVSQEDWGYDDEEYQAQAASLLKSGKKTCKRERLKVEFKQDLQHHRFLREIQDSNDQAESEDARSEDPVAAALGGAPVRPSEEKQVKNLEQQEEKQEQDKKFVADVQQQIANEQEKPVHMPLSPSLPTSSKMVDVNMLNEALLLQQDTSSTNTDILAKRNQSAPMEAQKVDDVDADDKNRPQSAEKKAAQAQAAASSAAISQTAAVVSTFLNDPESVEARTCCASILKVFHDHCDRPTDNDYSDTRLFVIIAVIGFCGMVKSLIRYFRIRWLPEAAGCILVGVMGGFIMSFIPHFDINFDGEFFLRIMVPPIVFEAALSIDKRSFNRHFTPILIFATAGTLLSTAVTAFIVHRVSILLGSWCATIPVAEALIFGALISSIDPIAVLSVLSSMGMTDTDTIYVVIFGESLLNDGVAIVLFETLVHFLDDSLVIDSEAVLAATVHFFVVAIGSVLIGLMCGALSTVYYWLMHGCQTPLVEVLMFFCWSFIPYYIADGIKWSGIVAIVAAGFVMDLYIVGQKHGEESASHFDDVDEIVNGSSSFESVGLSREYTMRRKVFPHEGHLSRKARSHIGFVTEINATLMETAIFAYLGLFLFSSRYHWNFWLSAVAVFSTLVSRAVVVPIFGAISNGLSAFSSRIKNHNYLNRISHCRDNISRMRYEEEEYKMVTQLHPPIASVHIDPRMQVILWFAGLRGAMSFALVENIPLYDTVTGEGSRLKPELKAMTSATIMFTVFILGGATSYVLDKLGFSLNKDPGIMEMSSSLVNDIRMDDDKKSDSDTASVSSGTSASRQRDRQISDMMKDVSGTERLVRHRVPGVGTFSSFA